MPWDDTAWMKASGIFDKNSTSNIQTANNDVAHSKDSRLQELVNFQNTRILLGVKRSYK